MYENKVSTILTIIFKSESEQNILCQTKKDHKCHKQVTLKRDTSFYSPLTVHSSKIKSLSALSISIK